MSEKVRIGFVGTGFMGQLAHMINYSLIKECEIVAIAEPREELAKQVAARYGVKQIFKDHHDLLKNAEVDAIIASQPFANHINIVPDILNAKKALFTEKPIAIAPESGLMLANLAKENKVPYMIGYHKRSDPAVEYAKKVIDEWKQSGEYGKMRLVRITMPPGNWTGGVNWQDMLTSNEQYSGAVQEQAPANLNKEMGEKYLSFVNYYIHQVNAMRHLFGEAYKITFADKSGVLLAVESESGVCGTIEMAPYNTANHWDETFLVGFEKGYVKVELPAPLVRNLPGTVTIYKDEPEPVTIQPVLPRVSAMHNQALNFLAAVRGEKPVMCGPQEAAEDLKIAMDYLAVLGRSE